MKDGEELGVEGVIAEQPGGKGKCIYNLQGMKIADSEENLDASNQVYIVVDGRDVRKVMK